MKSLLTRVGSPTTKTCLILAFFILPLACTILGQPIGGGAETPVNGWNANRGPVVPHDKFPNDCWICHQGDGWNNIREDFHFDHEKETGTALTGAHERAECLRCHNDRGPIVAFSSRGCHGCHEDWHKGKLGTNCSSCHDETTWQAKDAIANHAMTRFPLVGAHAGVACWTCHPGAQVGEFKRAHTDCITCHRDTLAVAKNPDHTANGWTQDCQRCHTPTTWSASGFVHEFFRLTGEHKTASCNDCHTNGNFQGLSQDCSSCHAAEYRSTTNPNHLQAGFSNDCRKCHGSQGWRGANFTHEWPLQGAHAALSCTPCHEGGVYRGKSKECISCHQDDYNLTTNPNHKNANFSTDCTQCHDSNTWTGAIYNHAWSLTGAHRTTSCIKCHKNQIYKGMHNTCHACHKSNYDNTTNPNHRGLGFPTTCRSCHTTSAFKPSTFVHKFPLVRKHAVSCKTCHTVPTNFKTFNCLVCHEHNNTKMDDKHKGKKGYVYASPACYNCHPNGKG